MKILNKFFYVSIFIGFISVSFYLILGLNGYEYNYIFIIISIFCLIFCFFIYFIKIFYIIFFGNKEQKEKLRRSFLKPEEKMAEDIEIMKEEILRLKK